MNNTRENLDIRMAAAGSGLYLWQVAEALGVSEFSFSRKLRHELPDDEKQKILDVIRDLAAEQVQT